MLFYNAHEEYRFYQRKQIRLCLNQKARRRIIMTRINASINTAKEIINALMESDMVFYDRMEGNELSGRFNVQMTFAEAICYRPQYTVRKLRNLVLNRHGSLSIRTRIALAAVLSQCEFDTHENALIPVLFTSNKELIPIYKQFEKNWGKFNFEVSFIQDDDYEDLAPRYEINFMTGEWADIWVGGITRYNKEAK
jgi:hypothetical protein